MNTAKLRARNEIPDEYKWNIQAMYPDEGKVESDISECLRIAGVLSDMQGKAAASPESLLRALDLYSDASRLIENAFVYAHMKHDEDNSDAKYTAMYGKTVSALTSFNAMTSFLDPEIISAGEKKITEFISAEPGLEKYSFMLETLMLRSEHMLTPDQEFVLASLGESLRAPDEIFTMLNDVDFDFGNIKDATGRLTPLTHGTFSRFLESDSREVRKTAYDALYSKYREFNNTISAVYNSSVKTDVTVASLRGYSSSLEAALSPENIPASVYDNLVKAVHKYLPAMHKYVGIRKRVLGVDELKMYDIYKPLIKPDDRKYTFEEAVDICCEALAPLGKEYVSVLRNGLLNEKWVDIYENKGKTSGAYSFGSYDSMPYILMNFSGELRDVFTLIHESGHSMHAYYTRKTQPYIYGSHSIFTAEVASTVNETLLIHCLMDNAETDHMKAYIINFYLEEFKSTLFRQTMFAEFEKMAHEHAESGESLTAEYLNGIYNDLNTSYFGEYMSADDMIQYEWSRIPHFYSAFYVYQYATGFSAANAIANLILSGGEKERSDYLKFLTTGASDYPIELLRIAGVDMDTEEPVLNALSAFSELVDTLDELLKG